MRYSHQLRVRVSPATQQRIRDAARAKMITESVWLRQCIERSLADSTPETAAVPGVAELPVAARRFSIRIPPADGRLLKAVAQSRGLPTASYVSLLVRAHLHDHVPVPPNELRALREATEQLGRICRYLTQVDAFVRQQQTLPKTLESNMESALRLSIAIGHGLRGYMFANAKSWQIGGGPDA